MSARDDLGAMLRRELRCPMCSAGDGGVLGAFMAASAADGAKPLRVVAYRQHGVRMECRECGLRFSIDVENFARARAERERPSSAQIQRDARERCGDEPGRYLEELAQLRHVADAFVYDQARAVLDLHRQGLADQTPRRGRIRFPARDSHRMP